MSLAIIVMDVHENFELEKLKVFGSTAKLNELDPIEDMLELAKSLGYPIYGTQYKNELNKRIKPYLIPKIIHKSRRDAFHNTRLDEILKEQGNNELFIIGFERRLVYP